jgi:hypothetical protein
MASLPKPSASKSLSLGRRKPEFDNQTSPNINSPHPEREHLAFKANNELKPTDEVESQEQTCLEEEGDLTEKN